MSIWACGCDGIDHLPFEGSPPAWRLVTLIHAFQVSGITMTQERDASSQAAKDTLHAATTFEEGLEYLSTRLNWQVILTTMTTIHDDRKLDH